MQKDITKLTATLRNFANTLKNVLNIKYLLYSFVLNIVRKIFTP